jgi:NUDIX domain
MGVFKVTPLTDAFRIVIQPAQKKYSESLVKEVNSIWEEAVVREPWLFNGQFLNYSHYEENVLYGEFVEYKYFYSRTVREKLLQELQLYPVGVMGITHCNGRVLLGRRSDQVTLYRGLFEFVPAGSVDRQVVVDGVVDIERQYYDELEEESGIPKEMVKNIHPFLLVHDDRDHLVEIMAHIYLYPQETLPSNQGSHEYIEFHWLDEDSLQKHLQKYPKEYVPSVNHILTKSLI